jgi:hypothetical protein
MWYFGKKRIKRAEYAVINLILGLLAVIVIVGYSRIRESLESQLLPLLIVIALIVFVGILHYIAAAKRARDAGINSDQTPFLFFMFFTRPLFELSLFFKESVVGYQEEAQSNPKSTSENVPISRIEKPKSALYLPLVTFLLLSLVSFGPIFLPGIDLGLGGIIFVLGMLFTIFVALPILVISIISKNPKVYKKLNFIIVFFSTPFISILGIIFFFLLFTLFR